MGAINALDCYFYHEEVNYRYLNLSCYGKFQTNNAHHRLSVKSYEISSFPMFCSH
jgi:hypothetical protein